MMGHRAIQAVLFDMDGVLVDSFEVWYRLFCCTLEHFQHPPISREEFIRHAWAQAPAAVCPKYFPGVPPQEIAAYYRRHFMDFGEYLIPIPGSAEVLRRLATSGILRAVISNTHTELVHQVLARVGLERYIQVVVGSDQVSQGKPAPEMVELACERLGIRPRQALVVGDTVYDVRAARAAGAFAIGLGVEGDQRIERLEEVLSFLGLS